MPTAMRLMPTARRFSIVPSPEEDPKDPESGERLITPNLNPGRVGDLAPMEREEHVRQVTSLTEDLRWLWQERPDRFIGMNMTIRYVVGLPSGLTVEKKLETRGPDVMVVKDPFPKPLRNSWEVENEGGKYPDVIIEVLSKSTARNDRGAKKVIYQNIFRTLEYFMVDPKKGILEGYRLVNGVYQPIKRNAYGHLWSDVLEMALGLVYMPELGIKMARYFTAAGKLIPNSSETARQAMAEAKAAEARAEQEKAHAEQERARAEQEKARGEQEKARAEQADARAEQEKAHAEQERARAEQEKARAEQEKARAEQEKARAEQAEQEKARLREKLRELGIDPDCIG